MLWTFTDASGSLTAYDEQPVYFIQDAADKYLQRGSMSRGNSGLILADALHATMRYNTWSAKAYEPPPYRGGSVRIHEQREYLQDHVLCTVRA